MSRREQTVILVLFLFVIFTIPFEAHINAKTIILFSSYSIWLAIKYKTPSKNFLHFALAGLFFTFVFMVGFINTIDIHSALKTLEARLSLIIFPLLLLISGRLWTRILVKRMLIGFACVTIIVGLFIESELLLDLLHEDKPLSYFFYWRLSGVDLSERIDIHPTYLSMFSLLSIGIIFEFFIVNIRSTSRLILGFCLITYLTTLTLHLASRISLVILTTVVLISLIYVIRQYQYKSILIIAPFILILGWLFSLEIFALKSRLENKIGGLEFTAGVGPGRSVNWDKRTYAWYCATSVIKENILFGVGSGDGTNSLNTCYLNLEAYDLAKMELNTHNQFLDALLRNGIFGIASLLLMYFYGIYEVGIKRLYLIFTLIVVISSLTENILDRQKGTVFFGVFSTLLFRYYKENSPETTNFGNPDSV